MQQIRSCDKLPFAHKVNFSLKLFYERSTLLRNLCTNISAVFMVTTSGLPNYDPDAWRLSNF